MQFGINTPEFCGIWIGVFRLKLWTSGNLKPLIFPSAKSLYAVFILFEMATILQLEQDNI